jgi:hypothetical protein
MSTLDELTGSVMRSMIIRKVVRDKHELGEPLTPANVGLTLAGFHEFGELGEDELAAAIAELEQPEAQPAAVYFDQLRIQKRVAPAAEPEAEPEAQAEPEANAEPEAEPLPTMSVDELNEASKKVENDLVVARRAVLDWQQEQRLARNAFTNACIAFERGGKPITREQLQRETIAANQAYKQGIKDGTIQPPRLPGRATGSYFDRMSGHDGGPGSSDRFVRKSHNVGEPFRGGKRFARGDVFDTTTNRIRPKLPSEA